MKPLEITDQDGCKIKFIDKQNGTVFIQVIELCNDEISCSNVEINKPQAIQIIEHLKQCFEL